MGNFQDAGVAIMFPESQARAPISQGRMANSNGSHLEDNVAILLAECGYARARHHPENRRDPYYIPQERTMFSSIYDTPLRVDFYVWHPQKYPSGMIIECKHQAAKGSVDEKFPYTVLSLSSTLVPFILIIDGGGAKASAVNWCSNQARQSGKFRVYSSYTAFAKAVRKEGLL